MKGRGRAPPRDTPGHTILYVPLHTYYSAPLQTLPGRWTHCTLQYLPGRRYSNGRWHWRRRLKAAVAARGGTRRRGYGSGDDEGGDEAAEEEEERRKRRERMKEEGGRRKEEEEGWCRWYQRAASASASAPSPGRRHQRRRGQGRVWQRLASTACQRFNGAAPNQGGRDRRGHAHIWPTYQQERRLFSRPPPAESYLRRKAPCPPQAPKKCSISPASRFSIRN